MDACATPDCRCLCRCVCGPRTSWPSGAAGWTESSDPAGPCAPRRRPATDVLRRAPAHPHRRTHVRHPRSPDHRRGRPRARRGGAGGHRDRPAGRRRRARRPRGPGRAGRPHLPGPRPGRPRAGRRRGPGLHPPLADPGGDHPAAAGRPRRRGPGPDRHRQDRRVRAAGAVPARRDHGRERARGHPAGARPRPDPRARPPGGRRLRQLRQAPRRRLRARRLRRLPVRPAAGRTAPGRAGRRRHAGPRDRPPRARLAGPLRPADPRAGRGGRDAAHGLRGGGGPHPRLHPGHEADRAVLRHHAPGHPPHLRPVPERPGGGGRRPSVDDVRHDPPALPAGGSPVEVRGPEPDPRDRGARRRHRLRAHPCRHRGARPEAHARRVQGRGHLRRHRPEAAREDRRGPEGRPRGHPRGHRRRRPRPGRRAHLARGQLRHPAGRRVLRAPHRPHRPRRPTGRRRALHDPARALPAQADRADHPPAGRGDGRALRRRRQRGPQAPLRRRHHPHPRARLGGGAGGVRRDRRRVRRRARGRAGARGRRTGHDGPGRPPAAGPRTGDPVRRRPGPQGPRRRPRRRA